MTRTRQFLVPAISTLVVLVTILANPGLPLLVIGTMICYRAAAVQYSSPPSPSPPTYTADNGKIHCAECNIHLSSERHHAKGCTLRHVL